MNVVDKAELGKRLREARNKAGLTQEALAEKLKAYKDSLSEALQYPEGSLHLSYRT